MRIIFLILLSVILTAQNPFLFFSLFVGSEEIGSAAGKIERSEEGVPSVWKRSIFRERRQTYNLTAEKEVPELPCPFVGKKAVRSPRRNLLRL
jgi:hypothetical protein